MKEQTQMMQGKRRPETAEGGRSVGSMRHDEEHARGTQTAGRMLREGRHQNLMGGMAPQALTAHHVSGVVGDSLGDSLETAQTPPYLTGC